jgi:hypothetical protein
MFNNSVPAADKTVFITKINWLMLFREAVTDYSENKMKTVSTLCPHKAELLIVKAGGTYNYHWL